MNTFQDFEAVTNKPKYAVELISEHKASNIYKTALIANEYDRQHNITVNDYVKKIYSLGGEPVVDFTASNSKLATNFFQRFNTQRNEYSLGNGVTFTNEATKERLGKDFDIVLSHAGYNALIHGVTYLFWSGERLYNFDITEFVPLFDEETGALRAGVRFWQLDTDKPLIFIIYEEDGFTKYKVEDGGQITELVPKRAYKTKVKTLGTDREIVIEEEPENYSAIPIVPFYGSRLKESTLERLRPMIDSYDLILSGFANNLTDCAEIYWLISGCDGMTDTDLARFRDRLLLNHIAVGNDMGTKVEPYTQTVPHEAREAYLNLLKNQMYADFGALDVSSISSSARTATEIRASYQPLDENADDFEYQIISAIRGILALLDIDDTPQFKRNRIANETEAIQNVLSEAEYLDRETILNKLPNVTVDEVASIMERKDKEEENSIFSNDADAEEAY